MPATVGLIKQQKKEKRTYKLKKKLKQWSCKQISPATGRKVQFLFLIFLKNIYLTTITTTTTTINSTTLFNNNNKKRTKKGAKKEQNPGYSLSIHMLVACGRFFFFFYFNYLLSYLLQSVSNSHKIFFHRVYFS